MNTRLATAFAVFSVTAALVVAPVTAAQTADAAPVAEATATPTAAPTAAPKAAATTAPKPVATPAPTATATTAPKPAATTAPKPTATTAPKATAAPTATTAPKVTATTAPKATPAPTTAAKTAPTPTPTAKPATTAQASSLLTLLNSTRADNGLKKYTANTAIAKIAQDWANKLAAGTVSGSIPSLGSKLPTGWKTLSQVPWASVSDNPAVVSAGLPSTFVTGDYTDIGIGWARNAAGRAFVVSIAAKYIPVMPQYTVSQRASASAALVDMANGTRTAAGKVPATLRADLTAVAQAYADKMASGATGFVHNPDLAKQLPAGWQLGGENIAMRTDENLTALHAQWVKSPSHYTAMVGEFSHVGIAVSRAKDGSVWAVQVWARFATTAKMYTASESASAAKTVLAAVNTTRAKSKLAALATNAKMQTQAQAWATTMAVRAGNAAKPSFTSGFTAGAKTSAQAHAVSTVSTPAGAAAAIQKANAAVLAGGYSHVGIGVARALDGKIYVSVFLATYPATAKLG